MHQFRVADREGDRWIRLGGGLHLDKNPLPVLIDALDVVGGERVALGPPENGGWIAAESLNALLLLLESRFLASAPDFALAAIRFLVVDRAGWAEVAHTSAATSSMLVASFNLARLDIGDG